MDEIILGRILSLQAAMYAINAEVEGMKAENMSRESNGMSVTYAEEHFNYCAEQLRGISAELAELVRG